MVISHEYPPNMIAIAKAFPVDDLTVYTYGSTLYAPHATNIPEDLLVHEETHSRQQGLEPALWWDKYIADPQFRLKMELGAYRAQYRFYKKLPQARQNPPAFKLLLTLARDLSGPLYGHLVDYYTAIALIKQ